MQVVIETGSKQYLVSKGDEILVEKLDVEEGKEISLDRVLLSLDGENIVVGKPILDGAKVIATLVKQEKGPKRIIFKYRRREQYKRKVGHRQQFSRIKIEKIEV